MTAETVALFLVGFGQPFLEEWVLRNKLSDQAAHAATLAASALLALAAVYVTGGFAGGHVPAFTLLDPSPLLGFLVAKIAPVYALSQIVFNTIGGTVRKIAGTAA